MMIKKGAFFLKKLGVNASLSLLSLLLIFFCIEIAMRLFFPVNVTVFDYSRDFGWTHVPNFKAVYLNPEFRVMNEYNAQGLRSDVNYSYKKPENTYRILALGASSTEARAVSLSDTWTRRLELKLNMIQTQKNVEVLNAGVAGYGTHQSYAYLVKEGIKFEPDLVLYLFTGAPGMNINGLVSLNPDGSLKVETSNVSALRAFYFKLSSLVKRNSYFISYLTDTLGLSVQVRLAMQKFKNIGKSETPVKAEPWLKDFTINRGVVDESKVTDEEIWDITFKIMEGMNLFLEKKGIEFYLIHFDCDKNNPFLIDDVQRFKIPAIQICYPNADYENRSEEWKYRWFNRLEGHWNPLGNELVATQAFEQTKKDLLEPMIAKR